jgi:transaldolase
MELFIDTANVEEIKEAISWGCISGATTNPMIMSKEKGGYNFHDKIMKIVEIVRNPVSVEVTEEDVNGMIREAKTYASWHPQITIKIPMGIDGLKAVSILEKQENVRTNVTAIMATNQALLAALSGATYASIFYGRVSDMGYDPTEVISQTAKLYETGNIKTKIIVGSIRNMLDINKALLAGADIVTVPFKFLKQMTQNLKTQETVKEFNGIWREMKEKGLIRLDVEEKIASPSLTLVGKSR